jgi:hypothetical protein
MPKPLMHTSKVTRRQAAHEELEDDAALEQDRMKHRRAKDSLNRTRSSICMSRAASSIALFVHRCQ